MKIINTLKKFKTPIIILLIIALLIETFILVDLCKPIEQKPTTSLKFTTFDMKAYCKGNDQVPIEAMLVAQTDNADFNYEQKKEVIDEYLDETRNTIRILEDKKNPENLILTLYFNDPTTTVFKLGEIVDTQFSSIRSYIDITQKNGLYSIDFNTVDFDYYKPFLVYIHTEEEPGKINTCVFKVQIRNAK